jgi:hypothetical protein
MKKPKKEESNSQDSLSGDVVINFVNDSKLEKTGKLSSKTFEN